jgi:hypothetical protein
MKVSRLSFPINSPAQGKSAGRVYLDMIEGVLNVITDGIATPVGDVPVSFASTNLTDKTAAGVAMFTAANAAAQLALIGAAPKYLTIIESVALDYVFPRAAHGAYIRVTNALANTLTIEEQANGLYEAGTYFTVKNVGAGTLTITPESVAVTIVGTAAILESASVKVVRIAEDEWEVLPLA